MNVLNTSVNSFTWVLKSFNIVMYTRHLKYILSENIPRRLFEIQLMRFKKVLVIIELKWQDIMKVFKI